MLGLCLQSLTDTGPASAPAVADCEYRTTASSKQGGMLGGDPSDSRGGSDVLSVAVAGAEGSTGKRVQASAVSSSISGDVVPDSPCQPPAEGTAPEKVKRMPILTLAPTSHSQLVTTEAGLQRQSHHSRPPPIHVPPPGFTTHEHTSSRPGSPLTVSGSIVGI